MVGHAHYPALDPVPGRPASCSPAIARDLLRGEIGYGGLAVTDDLEMGAVTPRDVAGALAVEALGAGCDLLLYCADLDRAERARIAIESAARSSAAFARRLDDALERIDRFARLWPGPESGATTPSWEVARAAFDRFRSPA
jgi:beta-N-acetylhexosaminidase